MSSEICLPRRPAAGASEFEKDDELRTFRCTQRKTIEAGKYPPTPCVGQSTVQRMIAIKDKETGKEWKERAPMKYGAKRSSGNELKIWTATSHATQ